MHKQHASLLSAAHFQAVSDLPGLQSACTTLTQQAASTLAACAGHDPTHASALQALLSHDQALSAKEALAPPLVSGHLKTHVWIWKSPQGQAAAWGLVAHSSSRASYALQLFFGDNALTGEESTAGSAADWIQTPITCRAAWCV